MHTRQRRISTWFTTILLAATPPAVAVQIDDFSAPTPAVVNTTSPGGGDVIDGPRIDASILGERRLTNEGDALEPGDSITLGGGVFSAVSGSTTFPMILAYDFTSEPGGYVDWQSEAGLYYTFKLIDSNGQTFLDTIQWIDTTAGTLEALFVMFPDLPGGVRTDFVPFTAFTGTGDLSQVTGLRIRFNDGFTARGLDFTLSHVATHLVPEPSSFMLCCIALAASGLIAWRRRRVGTAITNAAS